MAFASLYTNWFEPSCKLAKVVEIRLFDKLSIYAQKLWFKNVEQLGSYKVRLNVYIVNDWTAVGYTAFWEFNCKEKQTLMAIVTFSENESI